MARETIGFVACVDFDGTIAQNAFPGIGKIVKDAKDTINKMYDEGIEIIISSCRTGSFEADAENYLRRHGIKYDYLNCNLPRLIEDYKQDCRKISADVYIDDKCVAGLPPWTQVYEIVQHMIKVKSEREVEWVK